jgi:hypothetical protein
MADLSDVNASQSIKIIGSDSTGVEQTPVQSTSNGGLHTNLRNNAGTEIGTQSNPMFTSTFSTSTNTLRVSDKRVLTISSPTRYSTQSITSKTGFSEFHVGGKVPCEATIARYDSASAVLAGNGTGNFNDTTSVAAWTNTGLGDSSNAVAGPWTYTTAQFYLGTGSAKLTFTKSSATDYPELSYNYSTPFDGSMYRNVQAAFRCTVGAGGSTSRTFQLRLTSGTAVRYWQFVTTTLAAEAWVLISGELENPAFTAGTGTFDVNNINQVSLRMVDGANRTGTLYVDSCAFMGLITTLDKIYSADGSTTSLTFDPVHIFNNGETALLITKNNSTTTAGEIQGSFSGITGIV